MKRSLLFPIIILLTGCIFIGRLFFLQVIAYEETDVTLRGASIKKTYTYPERGFIFDRNNKLLVANEVTYDIKVTPNEVKDIDTLSFCKLLKIKKSQFDRSLQRAKRYSPWLSSVFLSQLSKEDYAYLQERIHHFKGFSIQRKSLRSYPHQSAANILGYVNEVNEELAKNSNLYEQGELIGTQGIEKQYETILRGKKGVSYKLRNRLNKVIGPYKEGSFDTLAQSGKDITLTIDLDLQQLGEQLMKNKKGGIVAIDPNNGEILALVTAPSYDPNLMVGRKKSANSVRLFNDSINTPTLDRGLQATYAPGSPFKLVQGLIGLQEGVIDTNSKFYCHHGYRYGKRERAFMGCHCGIVGKPIGLTTAISRSCNSYFSNIYKRLIEKYPTAQQGVNHWAEHLKSFGLGQYLGYDLPIGRKGFIPNADYYDRYYPSKNWRYSTIISNAIGQGEIVTTPIQLANVTVAIANRGHFYTPHILKKTETDAIKNQEYTLPKYTTVAPVHFEPIIEGMAEVYKTGTAKNVKVPGIEICGKTGTVQNYFKKNGVKYNLADHSIFVAFAPKNNPKIALAVFVENGGYGSYIAAPITSMMIEKYIKGYVSNKTLEDKITNISLKEEYDKKLNTDQLEKSSN